MKISDIPSIPEPIPDVRNNLEKDEVEEPVVMESVENPSYQQLASLRSKFFYDRPGTENIFSLIFLIIFIIYYAHFSPHAYVKSYI